MAKYSAQITGLREAQRAFAELAPVAKAHLIEATEETCIAIRNRAVALVPVRYGYLRGAIAWGVNKRTGEGRVGLTRGTIMGAVRGSDKQSARIHRSGNRTALMMPSRYGHLVEFGTNPRFTKKTHAFRGAVQKRPNGLFMLPAAESERQKFLERCKNQGPKIERDLSVSRFQ